MFFLFGVSVSANNYVEARMSQFTQDFCDFAIVTSQQNDQKLLSQTFCTFNYIAVETDNNEKEKNSIEGSGPKMCQPISSTWQLSQE